MSTTALLHHLPHFGVAPRGPAKGSTPVSAVPPVPAITPTPALRPHEHPGAEAIRAAAEEARRVALKEAAIALAACEQQLADAEAAFAARLEEEIAEARARWCMEEGDRLAGLIGTGLDEVETRISEALAAVLRPFVSGAARARALDELARRVRDLLRAGAAGPAITITGSGDLAAALRAQLADVPGIVLAEGSASDLRITCDDSVLETQLSGWAAAAARGN
ncbi:hypothetical protein FHT36_004718 [Xanthobacter sp. SG618]|uniref:hypothetical protein n=1 Tax=Xanthobacter sp. SG618 TaxID=2587121 RepID=UPI00145DE43D|nr:hypothetical protein [Xanthobacter sp. SG618]NMN60787.1 hypothetical protein [Xanthobacter sp. SG618]